MIKAANSNNLCPICQKKPPGTAHHPFCSPRCADVDLGRWLKGSYAFPTQEAPATEPSEDDEI